MKKLNTEFISAKDADIVEIRQIVKNLFGNTSEEWLTIYDDSEEYSNYIQVHGGIEYSEDNKTEYLQRQFSLSKDEIKRLDKVYLVEYREYDDAQQFKHYCGYFIDEDMVLSFIEKYMNDESIDVSNWLDVTDQF